MSRLRLRSQWFQNNTQKVVILSLPLGFLLSLTSTAIGIIVPHYALLFIVSSRMMCSLGVFALALLLYNHQNRMIRLFMQAFILSGFLGIISSIWLIIETVFFGLPISYPSGAVLFEVLANLSLLIGLAIVSAQRRIRSTLQVIGYLGLFIVFVGCLLTVYIANSVLRTPILPALGEGLRITLSFFTVIFAWGFVHNQTHPYSLVSRFSRLFLVFAALVQMFGRTLFALRLARAYGMMFGSFTSAIISNFYFAGSTSDVVSLFAEYLFLIAVIAVFLGAIDALKTTRSLSFQYAAAISILLLSSLVAVTIISSSVAITLTERVLLVFLSPLETMIAVQTIGAGLLIGIGIIICIGGLITTYLSKLMMRPLDNLEGQIAHVTDPGITSYKEPSHLLFSELQSLSDNFQNLVAQLRRLRMEFREIITADTKGKQLVHSSQQDKLHFTLYNIEMSNLIQAILSQTQQIEPVLQGNEATRTYYHEILSIISGIRDLFYTFQVLRKIDAQTLPELSDINLVEVLNTTKNNLEGILKQYSATITLIDTKSRNLVQANNYITDIFSILLKEIIRNDKREEKIIDISISSVVEDGVHYWQTAITAPGWIISDGEKDQLFRPEFGQPQTIQPKFLLLLSLLDFFNGKIRVEDQVLDEAQYGTIFLVLLPAVQKKPSYSSKKRKQKRITT